MLSNELFPLPLGPTIADSSNARNSPWIFFRISFLSANSNALFRRCANFHFPLLYFAR